MGKYNKKKPERGQGDSQLYKRFCPKCFKVTCEWKCICGTPTRRMSMERTLGQIAQIKFKKEENTES